MDDRISIVLFCYRVIELTGEYYQVRARVWYGLGVRACVWYGFGVWMCVTRTVTSVSSGLCQINELFSKLYDSSLMSCQCDGAFRKPVLSNIKTVIGWIDGCNLELCLQCSGCVQPHRDSRMGCATSGDSRRGCAHLFIYFIIKHLSPSQKVVINPVPHPSQNWPDVLCSVHRIQNMTHRKTMAWRCVTLRDVTWHDIHQQ